MKHYYLTLMNGLRILAMLIAFPSLLLCQCDCKKKDLAIFFAVNDYEYLPNLSSPIKNIHDIADLFAEKFCFDTILFENPTFETIDSSLNHFDQMSKNQEFGFQDQLLIFFSGHGMVLDGNGFFLASNSDPSRLYQTSVPYSFLRPQINKMKFTSILVVIDACYSVTFDPLWETRGGQSQNILKSRLSSSTLNDQVQQETRILFSSDAVQGRTPDQSDFARKMVEGLISGEEKGLPFNEMELFAQMEFANPKPHASTFGENTNKGQYLFVPCNMASISKTGLLINNLKIPLPHGTFYWSKREQAYLPIPPSTNVINKGSDIEIRLKWPIFRAGVNLAVFLSIFAIILYVIIFDSLKGTDGIYICSICLALILILSSYFLIIEFFNQTIIKINKSTIVVQSHPFPDWRKGKNPRIKLKTTEIKQLFSAYNIKDHTEGYSVFIIDFETNKKLLISHLSDPGRAQFIEEILEQILNLDDAYVQTPSN